MKTSVAALHIDVAPERQPPTEFRIFRRGLNSSVKGDFLFDDQAAALTMGAFEEHRVDLTIDFDHHTLAAGSGVKAVSAGWFGLELRDGELWATNVRWTDEGAADLRAGRYRYFSPLFDFEADTGRIKKLINNALTNTPALYDIEALVAASSNHPTRGTTMPDRNATAALSAIDKRWIYDFRHNAGRKSIDEETTAALSLTASDREVCIKMNISFSDFAANNKLLEARQAAESGGKW